MRPLDNRERRKSAGIARARVCLKTHLGWMDGFPVSQSHGQLQWQMRPKIGNVGVRTITIFRDTLRNACVDLTRLTTQLPDATSMVVGDLEKWQASVSNLLESLKATIHENHSRLTDIPLECLDRDEIQNVTQRDRQFPELLNAIIWSHLTYPNRQALRLAWVARQAPMIAAYAMSGERKKRLHTLLLMADLALVKDSEDVEIFQRLLFGASRLEVTSSCFPHDARVFVCSLKNWRQGQNTHSVPALPSGEFDDTIVSFMDWLIKQEQVARRVALRMTALTLNILALQSGHESWSSFQLRATGAVVRLQSFSTWHPSADFHVEACRVAEELHEQLGVISPAIVTSEVMDSILKVLVSRSDEFCNALCDFLSSISASISNSALHKDGGILRIATVCEAADQFDPDEAESRWIQYYRLAAKFLKHSDSDRQLVPWSSLIDCQRRNGYLHASLRVAVFDDIDSVQKWPTYFLCLRELIKHPNCSGNCDDVVAWLLDESCSVEQTCLRFSQIANLPDALLPSIACLNALPGVNPKKAQSIVAKHFPDALAVQSEIEALENHASHDAADAHRAERLKNLKQRLSNPAPVSTGAVEKLKRKLDESAARYVFSKFRERVLAAIERFLHARIGGTRVCRELSVPRQLELVSCLLRLNEPYREFGLRLLRKCWSDTDWDQAKEPANAHFLKTLELRRLRVSSWLQDRSVPIEAEGHRHPLTLSFAPNEVETMLMGHYFGTCLSPGNINFFSAFANAGDINKRVVFARTATGQVVGRCLLALGDSGTLTTFSPYCHEETFPFSDHMAAFAAQIAEDMGTVVSHNGTVGILVAPEWYNDGACDLGNSVFREESPLRIAIRAASEDNIMNVTERALGTVRLSDTMLEMLVELPEFKSRPVLILPLIPHFEHREPQLGVSAILRAALLAFEAGERMFASRVLLKYGPSHIKQHQTNSGFMREALELLKAIVTMHPSVALRLLRETRHRSIRSDADQTNESRRELLASCFTALARPKLAAAMRN